MLMKRGCCHAKLEDGVSGTKGECGHVGRCPCGGILVPKNHTGFYTSLDAHTEKQEAGNHTVLSPHI